MRAGRKRDRHDVEGNSVRNATVAWAESLDYGQQDAAEREFAGLAMSEGEQVAAEALEEPEFFEPLGLPSRRKEKKRLGKAGQRSTCFLCSYAGERDTTLPCDDVNKIIEMLRQNTGRMDMTILGEMIADHYADFRRKINSQLGRGEKPLPHMSASTVVEHIRRHHQDPEVKQIVMLEELQEIREELIDICFERSNKDKKRKRGNKIQIDNLDKIIKLELLVQARDPAKMAMYSAGARVNPAIHKQGAVSSSTKNLMDFWRNVAQ